MPDLVKCYMCAQLWFNTSVAMAHWWPLECMSSLFWLPVCRLLLVWRNFSRKKKKQNSGVSNLASVYFALCPWWRLVYSCVSWKTFEWMVECMIFSTVSPSRLSVELLGCIEIAIIWHYLCPKKLYIYIYIPSTRPTNSFSFRQCVNSQCFLSSSVPKFNSTTKTNLLVDQAMYDVINYIPWSDHGRQSSWNPYFRTFFSPWWFRTLPWLLQHALD